MNNKNIRNIFVSTILCLLPVLLALSVYEQLPDQMPTHFNFSGEVDGYSSRAMACFGIPIFLVIINLFVHFSVNSDPKKSNVTGMMRKFGLWIVPVTSVIINTMIIYKSLGHNIPIDIIMPLLTGILFIVLGNYLPKCKQNYTIGIKLPWTLNNEDNWNKTHRLGARMMMFGGFLIVLSAFFKSISVFLFFIAIGGMTFVPMVYSYILYKQGS